MVKVDWMQRYRMVKQVTCPDCGGSGLLLRLHLDGTVEEVVCQHYPLRLLLKRLLSAYEMD